MPVQPSLFVSHGAPNLVLHDSPARAFLASHAQDLPRPSAIVCVSAHFETDTPAVVADPAPGMIYDFGGFEPELRRMVYPAPGDPALAVRIAGMIRGAGLPVATLPRRGYDHGTWVPLMLLYPDADIPVVQLSIQPGRDAAHHHRLGRALAPLRTEGVLVLGSGSLTHNLHEVFLPGGMRAIDSETPDWVTGFVDWMVGRIEAGDTEAVIDYRARAPFAAQNHPTDEHLLPLHVALGAAGDGAVGRRIHASCQYGVLHLDAYAFG
ncbi:4,5-DOPA dioxygenase extradiol [Tepidamorphus gemmatus]|uniref:4,5-DOPA dioxygenase extradiol n=1 Tax=Tepidamorphus gemmatus TaxID=747076 RepID=A0A4V2UZK7_9HYPH|nr:class III extradiol ring-cleavage dioxygenase [Tepidamorphus gemmatus]TCT11748.1 4,5-DOPA dioxygenase extradiol [Tepidamorphus gemmatus]